MVRNPGDRFPDRSLPDLLGTLGPLLGRVSGPALLILGHRDCKTTRQTLPYVDRIHRRRGPGAKVAAVLQDTPETARDLVSELDLVLPIRLEGDPYPLAAELGLTTVPTLVLLDAQGTIQKVSEGFRRDDLESFAETLGVSGPLFDPGDPSPALRPG
jgi:hypothetical protein